MARVTDLDCYVEAVASGTVLGIDQFWPFTQVDNRLQVFGADGLNYDTYNWWRDYGLIEVFWSRSSIAHRWQGHHFSIQLHRLPYDNNSIVNKVLRENYGEFQQTTALADLQEALSHRNITLEREPYYTEEYLLYRSPVSGAQIVVMNHEPEVSYGPDLGIGDIYQISSSGRQHSVLDRNRFLALEQEFSGVPQLPVVERIQWLSDHEPTDADQGPWWTSVLTHAQKLLGSAEAVNPSAFQLYLWFIREGLQRSADIVTRVIAEITETAENFLSHGKNELISTMPSSAEIVRTAFSIAPLTPSQVRWSDPTLTGAELSAQLETRNLIGNASRWPRQKLSADLQSELTQWLNLWPELR